MPDLQMARDEEQQDRHGRKAGGQIAQHHHQLAVPAVHQRTGDGAEQHRRAEAEEAQQRDHLAGPHHQKRGHALRARGGVHERPFGCKVGQPRFWKFTLGRNLGGFRTWVACSKAYASLISLGSCHAPAKNEMPTGNPKTNPAGTVMCGYPATAAGAALSMSHVVASPLARSIIHAGPPEGTTIASSLCLRSAASMPSLRVRRRFLASAS